MQAGRSSRFAVPASFAQERMWLLQQLEPTGSAYNVCYAWNLSGVVDVDALQRSLDRVVARHETLRTTLANRDRLVQIVEAHSTLKIDVHDMKGAPGEPAHIDTAAYIRQEARRVFDLERGPLFRAVLVVTSEFGSLLIVNAHHTVFDAWSLAVLMSDWAAGYNAILHGKPAVLPALPIQYGDYAAWQRTRCEGQELLAQEEYWRQKLGNAPELLALPTDRPRPAVATSAGDEVSRRLPAELQARIEAICKAYQVTPFVAWLSVLFALLSRYTGQDDLCVGAPISGRSVRETEDLIGVFLNTLVLRVQHQDGVTFAGLLRAVKQEFMEGSARQDLPFERVVEVVGPARSLSHAPLFQVLFTAFESPAVSWAFEGLQLTPHHVPSTTAKFDQTWWVSLGIDGSVFLEYSTDLFERRTADQMLGHFIAMAEAMVDRPDLPVARVPLLTAAERHAIVSVPNSTRRPYPREALIHDLVYTQVAARSEATAVECGDQTLTYAELGARVDRLAWRLVDAGVGRRVKVGLYLERSTEMVIALLAILKAGGTYVPLDPVYPAARVAFMLEDSQAPVVVTQVSLAEVLPPTTAQVLYVDGADQVRPRVERAADSTATVNADDLAYVIYTSGSTGQPKGVQVTHRNVVNFLMSMLDEPGFTRNDILLAVTTLSFDIAALELLLPLVAGGRVVIATRDEARDGAALVGLFAQRRVTVMQATPATWRLLLECGWKGTPGLKALCGGETLSRELATALLERVDELWNMYGPTETTIWSAVHRVRTGTGAVPIGRPIANTQMYVLDQQRQPVPIGVAGELYIGGDGVVAGYLNHPDLTADRFVSDPFHPDASARLYRTGDLANYRADGTFDWLGRVDDQVKLRGFRIELGEIEAALLTLPNINDAVVVLREDTPGDKRLMAYVTGPQGVPESWRDALRSTLPEYMIPSGLVTLDALPRTPNGKIDRRALPEFSADTDTTLRVAPRTALEETVAALFCEVLKLDTIGVHDDFFDFGGHSLLATGVLSRVRERLQVNVPLRDFFAGSTVERFAKTIEAAPVATAPSSTAAISPRARRHVSAVNMPGLTDAGKH
jgi:amino acid adenylation domain-containing protein